MSCQIGKGFLVCILAEPENHMHSIFADARLRVEQGYKYGTSAGCHVNPHKRKN